jgi:hypothetical protein
VYPIRVLGKCCIVLLDEVPTNLLGICFCGIRPRFSRGLRSRSLGRRRNRGGELDRLSVLAVIHPVHRGRKICGHIALEKNRAELFGGLVKLTLEVQKTGEIIDEELVEMRSTVLQDAT